METGRALRFLLGSLATWRLTHLLAREDGPGQVVVRLRRALGPGLLGELSDCFQCLSIWVAVPFATYVARRRVDRLAAWLALSGAACLLEGLLPPEPAAVMIDDRGDGGGTSDGMLWAEQGRGAEGLPIQTH